MLTPRCVLSLEQPRAFLRHVTPSGHLPSTSVHKHTRASMATPPPSLSPTPQPLDILPLLATLAHTFAGYFQHQSPRAVFLRCEQPKRNGRWLRKQRMPCQDLKRLALCGLQLSDESCTLQTTWIFDKESRGMDRRMDGRMDGQCVNLLLC